MERIAAIILAFAILTSCNNSQEDNNFTDLITLRLGLKSFLETSDDLGGENPSLDDLADHIEEPLLRQFRDQEDTAYVFDRRAVQAVMPGIVALDFRGHGAVGIFSNGNVVGCEELLRLITNGDHSKNSEHKRIPP